jgi:hypothetical protein
MDFMEPEILGLTEVVIAYEKYVPGRRSFLSHEDFIMMPC